MDTVAGFEGERPRLVRIAARVLDDPAEAEDVVQQAWLRLHGTDADAIESLPAWLTTVVTRLCLDRLKARVPRPHEPVERPADDPDPAAQAALVDEVGSALRVVLDRLTPGERVAFVLHDSFMVDFPLIAEILGCSPAAARKLASRARGKVAGDPADGKRADHVVVDAFLAAARRGEFARLVELLAPDVVVAGDPVAVGLGTPARIDGREDVATFFNGAAASALPVSVAGRPGAAWFDRGTARVVFDFDVADGLVARIDFRAEPEALATVRRRRGGEPR